MMDGGARPSQIKYTRPASGSTARGDWTTRWTTFAVDWTPDWIAMYVDGKYVVTSQN
eukprot:COSAG01_NODE_5689_length_4100_cov_5.737795_6_plen_57_part_00